jgi:hypothetical protein
MHTKATVDRPSWIELESVLPPPKVEEITSLSWDTVVRVYPDKIVDLSPRRRGVKLRHALEIADGQSKE